MQQISNISTRVWNYKQQLYSKVSQADSIKEAIMITITEIYFISNGNEIESRIHKNVLCLCYVLEKITSWEPNEGPL